MTDKIIRRETGYRNLLSGKVDFFKYAIPDFIDFICNKKFMMIHPEIMGKGN
jgi:hypothetical protein